MTVRVACVGGAVLDFVYSVERLPCDEGKTHASTCVEMGGGMAANAAVAVTRLGGSADWWGRLGDDDKGCRILEGLRQENISLQNIRIIEGAVSPHSVVLADPTGKRAIVLYQAKLLDPDPTFLPLETVSSFDAVLADNRWIEGAIAALTKAREMGRFAVLDADSGSGPQTIKAVRCATHAIFSEPGLKETYNTQDIDAGLRRAVEDVPFAAVTLGERGLFWRTAEGNGGSMNAFSVDTLETIGAGDVFHGAFAFALGEGRAETDAMRFASAAAALKCAGSGGRRSFPSKTAVNQLVIES